MRHLMWILTWIAVGIGGALGAASVLMLTASRHPTSVQSPDVVAGSGTQRQGAGHQAPARQRHRPQRHHGAANRHAEAME